MHEKEFICVLAAILTGSSSHSAQTAVQRAREIVAEVEATQPKEEE